MLAFSRARAAPVQYLAADTRRETGGTAAHQRHGLRIQSEVLADGRWLAYVVDQLERSEVYVRGYPSGEPIPVSSSGGAGPVWSRDGRTLFYESAQSGGRTLMSVPVSVDGGTLKLGAPSRVVSLALAGGDEYGRSAYWGPDTMCFRTATS